LNCNRRIVSNQTEPKARRTQERPLLSIGLNFVLPAIILTRFSGEDALGPVNALLLALAFPLMYGLYDFYLRRSLNAFSALGFVGIALTGGIGLLRLDPRWIAVKEAAIPLLIGLAVIASIVTKSSFVRNILMGALDEEKVDEALKARGNEAALTRRLVQASYIFAGSFFLSAALNYVLARLIVVSPPGTSAFNEELGRMTALSFPVITVPVLFVVAFDVYYLVSGITKLTGLDWKETLRS
jgi:hypothetical protein